MSAIEDRRRGAALIVVLMFAALVAGLVGAVLRTSLGGARAAVVFADAMQADDLALGIGDLVTAYVRAGGPERRRAGAFSAEVGEARIDVDYRSESARIDVNAAASDLLAALFVAAGADPSLTGRLKARIEAFRHPPADATTVPAPRLQSVLQVGEAWGVPDPLVVSVLPALTVASHSAQVDPTLADRLVIAALMGGDETRTDDFLAKREQGFVNNESALILFPDSARTYAGFQSAAALRALAIVEVRKRFRRRYSVVLTPETGSDQMVKVHSWQPLY